MSINVLYVILALVVYVLYNLGTPSLNQHVCLFCTGRQNQFLPCTVIDPDSGSTPVQV